MGSFIRSVYSNPQMLGGSDDAAFLIVVVFVVVLSTTAFMATLGRRIGRRSLFLAILAGCAFVPTLVIAAAFLVAASGQIEDGHGGAMLALMILLLGMWTVPVSLVTSLVCGLVQRYRP